MQAEVLTAPRQQNEILTAIYNRRAIRHYEDKPVSKNFINQLLDAARMAPTAKNTQLWKFYVLTNKELIHALSKDVSHMVFSEATKKGIKTILKGLIESLKFIHNVPLSAIADPIFYGAPVVIFITAPKGYEWADLDIGMCAQNMMLAATSLGLASCPIGAAKFVEHAPHYAQLNIPENECIHLALIVGYSHAHPHMPERKKDNVIYIE